MCLDSKVNILKIGHLEIFHSKMAGISVEKVALGRRIPTAGHIIYC